MEKEKTAANPNDFRKLIKFIQVTMAEGPIREPGLPRLEGKKFRSPKALQDAIEVYDRPESGYDKVHTKIIMRSGEELTGFRYDHGERDPSFEKQLDNYIKRSIKMSAEKVARYLTYDDLKKAVWASKLGGSNASKGQLTDMTRNHRQPEIEFTVGNFPYLTKTFRLSFNNSTQDVELSDTSGGWYRALADEFGVERNDIADAMNSIGLRLKPVSASFKRKAVKSLPKFIEKMIKDSGYQSLLGRVQKELPQKMAGKKTVLMRNKALSNLRNNGWSMKSYLNLSKPITVKGTTIGNYILNIDSSEGTVVKGKISIEPTVPQLNPSSAGFTVETKRYKDIDSGVSAIIKGINKASRTFKPLIAQAVQSLEKEHLSQKKWMDAIDKRAKTAFRKSIPYKNQTDKLRGFKVFEIKGGARKPIYYVAFGMNNIVIGKKGMAANVFAIMSTYKDNLEKYLKVDLDDKLMNDYFYENESLYERRHEFKNLSEITQMFKSLTPYLKKGIAIAKEEGKEATPQMAAFLQRKSGKVGEKRTKREEQERRKQQRKNIGVYQETRTPGYNWSAVWSDEGYAESVYDGFKSSDDAKDFILEREGDGWTTDWNVVYGTQMHGKRLGVIEEE